MTSHKFGGMWTKVKLTALEQYLRFYSNALKNQNFKLIYIDAFAGTGSCDIKENNSVSTIKGSAKIALEIEPPFHKIIFIDEKRKHVMALQALRSEYDKKAAVDIYHSEANDKIKELCNEIDWQNHRAVMFLDPYGLNVKWETLKTIAATGAIDICFLFSLSGLYRQAAKNYELVDEHKAKALDTCLGTTDWRNALYKKTGQRDLFNDEQGPIRDADVTAMENYVKTRLESIFPAVSKPLRLPKTGAPMYSLFIAVSNKSPKAIGLAMKVAKHIFSKT